MESSVRGSIGHATTEVGGRHCGGLVRPWPKLVYASFSSSPSFAGVAVNMISTFPESARFSGAH